jgi:hypothetical protein
VNIAPAIYVRLGKSPRLSIVGRLIAFAICTGAITVLYTAASIEPSATGVGTHLQLGMQPCGFLQRTGLPCAGCGMTTSFAHLVRGHVISSFVAQPFGMFLCILCAASVWAGAYIAITGKASHRLVQLISTRVHIIAWPTIAISAWLWKVALISIRA